MTTPPTPTREQIDAALASCQEWFSGMAFGAYQLAHVRILTSAIPALKNAHHETLDLLEAERKAHAEALGRVDTLERLTDELERNMHRALSQATAWQSATGHASPEAYRASLHRVAAPTAIELGKALIDIIDGRAVRIDADGNPERLYATWLIRELRRRGFNADDYEGSRHEKRGFLLVDTESGVVSVRFENGQIKIEADAPRGTPEAYRASRVEPGAGVIEMLLGEAVNAAPSMCYIPRESIRAVVASLAEMGAEALPTPEELARAEHAAQYAPVPWDERLDATRVQHLRCAEAGLALVRAHLAPVLGARRALESPSEEEIAEAIWQEELTRQPEVERVRYPTVASALAAEGAIPRAWGERCLERARAVLDLLRSRPATPTNEQLAEKDCPPSCTGSCAACCRARREGRR